MTVTATDLVRREVFYCVSSLVSTLAGGYGAACHYAGSDLDALTEQAAALASSIEDYEAAAIENGWSSEDEDSYLEFCHREDVEPNYREVFEHWIVSDWLADRLAEHGEKVDKDFAGMIVWARTATGQGIAADSVIEQIAAELSDGRA